MKDKKIFNYEDLKNINKQLSQKEISNWRGDSSLESAISYLTGSPIVIDNIKEAKEEIFSLIVEENDER